MGAVVLIIIIVWVVIYCREKGKGPSRRKKTKRLTAVERINSVAIGGIEIPEGGRSLLVYVYDGTPIEGITGPVKFVVAPGVVSMTSIYTGKTWCNGCAVYAGGQPVGFMSDKHPSVDIKNLAHRYGHAVVHGRVRAPFRSDSWPVVYLDLPEKSWFDEAKENAKRLQLDKAE